MLILQRCKCVDLILLFSNEQYCLGRERVDIIPRFVVEVISKNDNVYKLEGKVAEYFKTYVKVVWNILLPAMRLHLLQDDLCLS